MYSKAKNEDSLVPSCAKNRDCEYLIKDEGELAEEVGIPAVLNLNCIDLGWVEPKLTLEEKDEVMWLVGIAPVSKA